MRASLCLTELRSCNAVGGDSLRNNLHFGNENDMRRHSWPIAGGGVGSGGEESGTGGADGADGVGGAVDTAGVRCATGACYTSDAGDATSPASPSSRGLFVSLESTQCHA